MLYYCSVESKCKSEYLVFLDIVRKCTKANVSKSKEINTYNRQPLNLKQQLAISINLFRFCSFPIDKRRNTFKIVFRAVSQPV